MRILLKIWVLFILILGFHDDLQAQSENSKASSGLDSTDIIKIREFFPDSDSAEMIKIKQMVPNLDRKKLEIAKKLLSSSGTTYKFGYKPWRDTAIIKGSELHIHFTFDKFTTYIEVEGVGRAGMKDIKAGKWHIITKPTKTTTYRIIHVIDGSRYSNDRLTVKVVETEAEQKKALDEFEKERRRAIEASKAYTW